MKKSVLLALLLFLSLSPLSICTGPLSAAVRASAPVRSALMAVGKETAKSAVQKAVQPGKALVQEVNAGVRPNANALLHTAANEGKSAAGGGKGGTAVYEAMMARFKPRGDGVKRAADFLWRRVDASTQEVVQNYRKVQKWSMFGLDNPNARKLILVPKTVAGGVQQLSIKRMVHSLGTSVYSGMWKAHDALKKLPPKLYKTLFGVAAFADTAHTIDEYWQLSLLSYVDPDQVGVGVPTNRDELGDGLNNFWWDAWPDFAFGVPVAFFRTNPPALILAGAYFTLKEYVFKKVTGELLKDYVWPSKGKAVKRLNKFMETEVPRNWVFAPVPEEEEGNGGGQQQQSTAEEGPLGEKVKLKEALLDSQVNDNLYKYFALNSLRSMYVMAVAVQVYFFDELAKASKEGDGSNLSDLAKQTKEQMDAMGQGLEFPQKMREAAEKIMHAPESNGAVDGQLKRLTGDYYAQSGGLPIFGVGMGVRLLHQKNVGSEIRELLQNEYDAKTKPKMKKIAQNIARKMVHGKSSSVSEDLDTLGQMIANACSEEGIAELAQINFDAKSPPLCNLDSPKVLTVRAKAESPFPLCTGSEAEWQRQRDSLEMNVLSQYSDNQLYELVNNFQNTVQTVVTLKSGLKGWKAKASQKRQKGAPKVLPNDDRHVPDTFDGKPLKADWPEMEAGAHQKQSPGKMAPNPNFRIGSPKRNPGMSGVGNGLLGILD